MQDTFARTRTQPLGQARARQLGILYTTFARARTRPKSQARVTIGYLVYKVKVAVTVRTVIRVKAYCFDLTVKAIQGTR